MYIMRQQYCLNLQQISQFKALFTKTMFDQINTDFGNYIDALARSKPKSLHHVYEWKRLEIKQQDYLS
jgi:hypothetical protein